MSTLDKALKIAMKAHAKQTDKFGAPYILHPMRVMAMGRTDDERIVGILHDVIEDSDYTFDDLRTEGFSEHILAALDCITKRSDSEDYDDFVNRTLTNTLAMRVKLNDLTDNMDLRRMEVITERDMKRLNKYIRAWKKITAQLDKENRKD